MEVISDVRRLPCEYYYFGPRPFYKFQYTFVLHHCLLFLWHSFTEPDGNIVETTRRRGLTFVPTRGLFLLPVQAGCYFLAAALRLIHLKFTRCLELRGDGSGGKVEQQRQKR